MTKDEALAMDLALEAIAGSGDFLFNWHDCEPNNEHEMSRYQEVLAMNEKAFTALKKVRALDKKAENARELGLDYEPVAWNTGVPPLCPEMKDGETISVEYTTPPVQEPVAWVCKGFSFDEKHAIDYWQGDVDDLPIGTQLYPTPPAAQRQWVSLTTEERMDILLKLNWDKQLSYMDTALAIEAKLKEKNT